MVRFFRISHNSFETRGFPWAQHILGGLDLKKICHACAEEGRRIRSPHGTVTIQLERNKGTRWPDVLGCGAWSLFIVSKRVLDDWRSAGISGPVPYPISIAEPLPERLRSQPMPEYFWLDGEHMFGAKLNFEASGYVDVTFCKECGARTDNIRETHRRQHSGVWPMAFVEGTWKGTDIFTTDLSRATFFCTNKVLECAKKNRHTNFLFVPAEVAASSTEGIKYM